MYKYMYRLGQFLVAFSFILIVLFRDNILVPLTTFLLGVILLITGLILRKVKK